ncbi:ABC transporter permease [Actinoplanes sp. NPDC051343]|uniref:ABC transporter permease n=1 Tax=Actinoplanes sp. NPDC051343 TaxID=3363906 RepID=UPI003790794A
MKAVLRTQLGGVLRRPARLLLTGLAVLVVSFVVYSTVLAQQITRNSLLNGLSDTPVAADVVVHDGRVTTGMLNQIKAIPGVAEASGEVEAGGQFGADFLEVVGDPGTGPLAKAKLASGRYPTGPNEVAATPRTVDRLGLKVGSQVSLALRFDKDGKAEAPAHLTVVGTVTVPGDFGSQLYASQPAVSALTGDDALNQIDLRLAPGADAAAVQDKARSIVGAGLPATEKGDTPTVATGADVRHAEAQAKASDIDSVFAVVGMFVAIAVVAAGLVATSTFRIVFAQRLRQLALLRAIGANRRSLSWSLAVEGVLTGLVTGLVGMFLALGAGHLVTAIGKGLGWKIVGPGFPVLPAVATVVLAVVITMLAVIAPAFSAAKVAPLEALRTASTTGGRKDIGKLRWVVGLLLALGAVAIAAFVVKSLPGAHPKDYNPNLPLLAVVASGALAFFALIALGPVIVRPVLAAAGWPLRRSGPTGRLAAGGVGGAPRRAAAVSVVVALGVTLIAGTLVGGASIKVRADRQAALSAPADYELTASDDVKLPANLEQQIAARPELAHVAPYRRLDVKVAGFEGDLDASDLKIGSVPRLSTLDIAAGRLADLGPGKVALSDFTATDTGLTVGDTARITHGKKTVNLKVAALFADSAPLGSSLVLDPSDMVTLGAPADAYSGLLADQATAGEQGRAAGRKAIADLTGSAASGYAIEVLADQRDEISSELNVILAIAVALMGLTVLIAVVGVGTTTALSVVERVREAGLLRAVGLSRGGLRTMLTTEAALYGVIGALLGLVLGIPYAWLAVAALGVNAPLTLPIWQLLAVFVVLVLLTAAAGVLPARRAAKVSPVAALATD